MSNFLVLSPDSGELGTVCKGRVTEINQNFIPSSSRCVCLL